MRKLFAAALVLLSSFASGQPALSQTARQALIEMFFGQSPNHLEKHLPDVTRRSLGKFSEPGGQSYLSAFSMMASQIHASGTNFQTFETGPTLLSAENLHSTNGADKIDISVERDDLIGEADEIELALHLSNQGKEETLPFVPRFTFSMQSEANVWRLSEITVTVRVPLADPTFLKTIEDEQRAENEQLTIRELQMVNAGEKSYSAKQGRFGCSLSALGTQYLYDPQLVKGTRNGYVFVISGCDGSRYKVVAEPAVADSGLRAFCSDEVGDIRASSDGKATTCLASGELAQKAVSDKAIGIVMPLTGDAAETSNQVPRDAPQSSSAPQQGKVVPMVPAAPRPTTPTRIRVSQGVTQGLILSKVQPIYPLEAKVARVQGMVVMKALIGTDGTIKSLSVIDSPSPLLSQAAMDAVKQWTYRPYILNGTPVDVDTQITVNFTLSP